MRVFAIVAIVGALSLTACGGAAVSTDTGPVAEVVTPCGDTLQKITQSAQEEGSLTLIGTPDDWANYGAVIDGFKADYGINVDVVLPFANSAEQLDAVSTSLGEPGRPDVINIGASFADEAIERDLVSSYKPTTWSQIPAPLKDPDGRWIGSYFGLLGIGVNTDLVDEVPQGWQDLDDPRYRGQVFLRGDPRENTISFAAVVGAALANGGSYDDITPGIDYFARLAQTGNLRIDTITPEAVVAGDVPIVLDWAFNLVPVKRDLSAQGTELAIQVPSDGISGSYYAASITKDPEHPCAAQLWMEHLLGDAAAIGRLNGLAIPARFAAIDAYNLIPPASQQILPSSNDIYRVQFPTTEQLALMNDQLRDQWSNKVDSVLWKVSTTVGE